MALEKTEALLVTDRRGYKSPQIVKDEFEVKWRRQIKYLGVELNGRLNIHHHMATALNKAIECAANLARVMPNVGGLSEKKMRLVASVAHAKFLYTAPAWAPSLRTNRLSTSAVQVLASVPPAGLLALEREEIILLLKEANSSEEKDRPSKDCIRVEARHKLVEKWHERWDVVVKRRWTYHLIPTLVTWLSRNHDKDQLRIRP
ncbi:uncharacterized protein LOC127278094 [Leptopilina boulardi]|uniref:uncharacterized protein LOC127278094 n=1 Tax=Leptopilina boulardi TaxID=63433 RepID=UPI0021F65AED|nr:uncharacterized protein LOC127278094 [Leptopilina boulardi]